MKKLILGLSLIGALCVTPAVANPAQIAVAKQAIYGGEIMPYATPELRRLLVQAYEVDEYLAQTIYEPTGCEFYESFYLGHGQDSLNIKNWAANASNNTVRITFSNGNSYSNLVVFSMKGNQIDDVQYGYSDNPRIPSTQTETSLKSSAQRLINAHECL